LPLDVLKKVDLVRKDIPRSRYILRLIENNFALMDEGNKSAQSLKVTTPPETVAEVVTPHESPSSLQNTTKELVVNP
jgi:hypothetical protein